MFRNILYFKKVGFYLYIYLFIMVGFYDLLLCKLIFIFNIVVKI